MKPYGLYTAAHALHYWENRQKVASHNLANVETSGFKAERVFARLIEDSYVVAETETDFREGKLTPTGRALDLALEGPGFLVVETGLGERLIRGGSLRLDELGRIIGPSGDPLLGERGHIYVPAGDLEIDSQGLVRVDGVEVDILRIETVPPGTEMIRESAGGFLPDAETEPIPLGARNIRQGYLEASNVSAIESMVELIDIQRSFAAVQRTVLVNDGVLNTIANQIGRNG